jgi:hypothetical protein
MKKSLTIFLRGVIVLVGLVTLFILIRFPLTEGRAVGLDLFSVYADPFIIYGYIASVPFFVALYQAFQLLRYIGHNKVFSPNSVKALKIIKYSAITQSVLIALAVLYVRLLASLPEDDPAGFIAVAMVTIFIAVVIATAAAVFEKTLQSAVDIKSENDLTV